MVICSVCLFGGLHFSGLLLLLSGLLLPLSGLLLPLLGLDIIQVSIHYYIFFSSETKHSKNIQDVNRRMRSL